MNSDIDIDLSFLNNVGVIHNFKNKKKITLKENEIKNDQKNNIFENEFFELIKLKSSFNELSNYYGKIKF